MRAVFVCCLMTVLLCAGAAAWTCAMEDTEASKAADEDGIRKIDRVYHAGEQADKVKTGAKRVLDQSKQVVKQTIKRGKKVLEKGTKVLRGKSEQPVEQSGRGSEFRGNAHAD